MLSCNSFNPVTGMDKISPEGMGYLSELLQTFKIMGIDTIITGVHPEHAKQLHTWKQQFICALKHHWQLFYPSGV